MPQAAREAVQADLPSPGAMTKTKIEKEARLHNWRERGQVPAQRVGPGLAFGSGVTAGLIGFGPVGDKRVGLISPGLVGDTIRLKKQVHGSACTPIPGYPRGPSVNLTLNLTPTLTGCRL